jgi:asparagine synthase (glutamine-hydrolysing)
MCGIAGIVTAREREARGALDSMKAALAHRGPDHQGTVWRESGNTSIGLAHTRLSIIDLSDAGNQPMRDASADLWLTFNGEIYNYLDLREQLQALGYPFHSHSDTESLLQAYRHWGLGAMTRLRGMFAFAMWDGEQRVLVLARDPLGIKPLYYYQANGTFLFASELRALLASGLAPRRLSREGVLSYLRYGSVQSPLTIIDGVRSLDPGHMIVVRTAESGITVEVRQYAELQAGKPDPPLRDRRDAAERLRSLLEESVRLHLASDVPLGVFLSGGIDSSALVALASRATGRPVRTFNVNFNEAEMSEAAHARTIAERFGSEHSELLLTGGDLAGRLPCAFDAMDQPTIDGINTYVISRAVKEAGLTVAISGLGADELFAGYPSFTRAVRARNLRSIPAPVRRVATAAASAASSRSVRRDKLWDLIRSDGSPAAVYEISRQLFAPGEIERFTRSRQERTDGVRSTASDPVNSISIAELRGYMANTLLRDTDFMSMAHALEVRVPFVDSVVVEWLLSVPGDWKVPTNGRPKPLLLDALDGLLPESIWRRPKRGFVLPFKTWMQSDLKPDLERVFATGRGWAGIGIDAAAARSVWDSFTGAPDRAPYTHAWSLYTLNRWCERNRVTE